MATTISRLLEVGEVDSFGVTAVVGGLLIGAVAVWLAPLLGKISNKSTTRRCPYCWLGVKVKLFEVTCAEMSKTMRSSSASRLPERTWVIGELPPVKPFSSAESLVCLISITIRSGALKVNTLCSTGPVRSNTRRVLSGARHKRTLLICVIAKASSGNNMQPMNAASKECRRTDNLAMNLSQGGQSNAPTFATCAIRQ